MVQITFNPLQYDPSTGGQDVFPAGDYSFIITKSDLQQTQAGGTMLVMEATCQDEGFAGKRTSIRLNLVNNNPQAVEIAYRDLSAICHVVGWLQPLTDTQMLHGRPFRMRLAETEYQKRDGTPGKGNEIKGYFDIGGNPPSKGQQAGGAPTGGAPQAPQQPQPPQQPAAAPAQAPAAPPAAPTPPAPPAAPPTAPQQPAAPMQQAAAPVQQAAPAAPASPPWGQQAAAPVAGSTPPWQQQ